MVFPRTIWIGVNGETMICSMVPRSFSRTTVRDVEITAVSTMMNPMRPVTRNFDDCKIGVVPYARPEFNRQIDIPSSALHGAHDQFRRVVHRNTRGVHRRLACGVRIGTIKQDLHTECPFLQEVFCE